MPFAKAPDGARLWFDVAGGRGDPILLIAGNGCDHRTWDGVHATLAHSHRVVRYDHRGTGRSDATFPAPWSTRDFAGDAASVLRAAGFERAHVYGHSMGGRVAQWLAIDAPECVGALILGASSPGGRHALARSAEATAAMARHDEAALRRLCYTDAWIAQNEDCANASAPNPRSKEAFLAHLDASSGHDAWDVLPSIAAPTLMVHGDDDRLTPMGNSELLAQRIPGARLMRVHGARHVYWAGFPQVDQAILAFCEEHAL